MMPLRPQLLVQLPDRDTLALLEDVEPLRLVAQRPGVHVFLIEESRITRYNAATGEFES